jgi:hypothetical protein
VICHGIPDFCVLKEGDIVNIDVTAYYGGFHGDLNATYYVGGIEKADEDRYFFLSLSLSLLSLFLFLFLSFLSCFRFWFWFWFWFFLLLLSAHTSSSLLSFHSARD